jgi:DNA-binding NarL/FixJ family response regulator
MTTLDDDARGPFRILICDDHRVLTDALAIALSRDPELSLAAPPMATPEEAIERSAELQPDVVLMDVTFGRPMDGIEATRRVKEVSPQTHVIVMTANRTDRLVVEALEAGASALLTKTEGLDVMIDAAKASARGEAAMDPRILAGILARVARQRAGTKEAEARGDLLSDRERQVLELLMQGLGTRDIARRLVLSPLTVQTHVRNILRKLRVRSRLEAVAMLRREE